MRKLNLTFFLCFLLSLAPPVYAEEDESWETMFISSNKAIGAWFDSFVDGIDIFLVGKRITNKPNETRVKIENTTFSSEGKEVQNVSSFSFNPRLNNLEEYMHLKFTNYDEQVDGRGVKNRYLRQNPRQRNYGATIGLFRKLGNIKTSFQPRIELQDPLKVSHSLGFESIAEYKRYKINPKIELYANPTKGVGVFQALNINFELNQFYSLTLINEGDYEEKSHLYAVTNGFSVGQAITDSSALTYNLLFNSNNQPKYHLDAYSLSVVWSEILYKGMVDYQIIPHLDFPMINNFKGIAGITFTFNINF